MENAKKMLVNEIASTPSIWKYNKEPTFENAKACIKGYEQAVIAFCKQYDEMNKFIVDFLQKYDKE